MRRRSNWPESFIHKYVRCTYIWHYRRKRDTSSVWRTEPSYAEAATSPSTPRLPMLPPTVDSSSPASASVLIRITSAMSVAPQSSAPAAAVPTEAIACPPPRTSPLPTARGRRTVRGWLGEEKTTLASNSNGLGAIFLLTMALAWISTSATLASLNLVPPASLDDESSTYMD